jgi:hypothetical protein
VLDSNGLPTGWFLALVIFLILWGGVWKAIALWKAARNSALAWFIVFCVLNTAGILEIIYIFAITDPSRLGRAEAENNQHKEEINL